MTSSTFLCEKSFPDISANLQVLVVIKFYCFNTYKTNWVNDEQYKQKCVIVILFNSYFATSEASFTLSYSDFGFAVSFSSCYTSSRMLLPSSHIALNYPVKRKKNILMKIQYVLCNSPSTGIGS